MILMGVNDAAALGSGWHPVQEGPGGVPCRWMSAEAEIQVSTKGLVTDDNRTAPEARPRPLHLTVGVSAPALIRNKRPGLSVYTDRGDLLGHCADLGDEGAWNIAFIPLKADALPGAFEHISLRLVTETRAGAEPELLAFVPHEVFANGDLRALGTLVTSIRLSSA